MPILFLIFFAKLKVSVLTGNEVGLFEADIKSHVFQRLAGVVHRVERR